MTGSKSDDVRLLSLIYNVMRPFWVKTVSRLLILKNYVNTNL